MFPQLIIRCHLRFITPRLIYSFTISFSQSQIRNQTWKCSLKQNVIWYLKVLFLWWMYKLKLKPTFCMKNQMPPSIHKSFFDSQIQNRSWKLIEWNFICSIRKVLFLWINKFKLAELNFVYGKCMWSVSVQNASANIRTENDHLVQIAKAWKISGRGRVVLIERAIQNVRILLIKPNNPLGVH